MGENSIKLSYDQLEALASQTTKQNEYLTKQLQETQTFAMFKRLDYLFKVLEYKELFKGNFVDAVIDELTMALTIPETTSETPVVESTKDSSPTIPFPEEIVTQ